MFRPSTEGSLKTITANRLGDGREAFSTTATGVAAARPASISRAATLAATEQPI